MSLLWATASLSQKQHAALEKVRALSGDPGRPEMASGEPVRSLMADVGITQHQWAPHTDYEAHPGYGGSATFHPYEELHTSQKHLWKPALEKYIREGHEHLCHPDYEHEDETSETEDDPHEDYHVPYHPQVYHHAGMEWIDEGHHRIIAARLLGKAVDVEHGDTHLDHDPTEKWD